MQFARYAARGTMWLLDPENLLNKLIQLAWTLEILILGFSFENVLVLQIIGLLLLISFLYLSVLNFKNIREFSRPDKLSNYLIHFNFLDIDHHTPFHNPSFKSICLPNLFLSYYA